MSTDPPVSARGTWGGSAMQQAGAHTMSADPPVATPTAAANDRLADLIARVALRDRRAFRQLYECTSRFLFSLVVQRLNNRAKAEDVLQDAFVEVWQKAANFSPALGKPMTWLITIVNNRTIDEVRRQRREGSVLMQRDAPADEEHEAVPDEGVLADSLRDYFGSDVMARLQTCLEQLPADQRRAITDIRVHGMTIDEAASHYGVPRQTAAAWVRRGIERLARCMKP